MFLFWAQRLLFFDAWKMFMRLNNWQTYALRFYDDNYFCNVFWVGIITTTLFMYFRIIKIRGLQNFDIENWNKIRFYPPFFKKWMKYFSFLLITFISNSLFKTVSVLLLLVTGHLVIHPVIKFWCSLVKSSQRFDVVLWTFLVWWQRSNNPMLHFDDTRCPAFWVLLIFGGYRRNSF